MPARACGPVAGAPEDTITRLRFIGGGDNGADLYLLSASWDGTVRLYSPAADGAADGDGDANADAPSASPVAAFELDAPVLDACFVGDNPGTVAAGLVGGAVQLVDLEAGGAPTTRLGATDGANANNSNSNPAALAAGARSVHFLRERGLVAAAGWDATLRLFDPRARSGAAQVACCPLPGKALAACVHQGGGGGKGGGGGGGGASGERLAVATTGRHVWTYCARSLCDGAPPLERSESALKGQIRDLACWDGGGGGGGPAVLASAGVEGKVAVSGGFRPPPSSSSASCGGAVPSFAFKCHRGPDPSALANPVHAVAFHPRTGALLTGGGDGSAACWDVGSKKRLASVPLASGGGGGGEEVVALAVADLGAGRGALVAAGLGSAVGRQSGGGRAAAAGGLVLARLAEAEVAPRQQR